MFFPETITVTRSGGGSYNSQGDFVPNATSTLSIDANVQPLRGRDLLILPEGEREKESLRVLTDVELLQVDEATGQDADLITWQGRLFKIHTIGYFDQIIPHYEAIAINVNKLRSED